MAKFVIRGKTSKKYAANNQCGNTKSLKRATRYNTREEAYPDTLHGGDPSRPYDVEILTVGEAQVLEVMEK